MSSLDATDRGRAAALMMAAIDGEATDEERRELDTQLAGQPDLRAEWARLVRVKEVTATMTLSSPPEELWERYSAQVLTRAERGVAWALVTAGAAVVGAWGVWRAVSDLFADANLPVIVKGGVTALGVGLIILLVSVARERIVLRRRDRYSQEIMR